MKRYLLSGFLLLLLTACSTPDGGYPGRYQADIDTQVIVLTLAKDGGATLWQDPGDGQAPQVDNGAWLGSEDSLDVTFDGAVLTFGRADDDSLTLVDDLTGIAPAGLVLQPTSQLMGTRWVWLRTVANGQVTDPSTPEAFTLTFNEMAYASMETDCNSGQGGFAVGPQRRLSLRWIATTQMFCEGSNEGDFYAQMDLVESYSITADGVLELYLGGEGGTMEFSPEA